MKQIAYFNLISLGCPKNRVDSERILHTMLAAGYQHTQDQDKSQIIVINTCAFIQPAVEESISAILDSASANPGALLIVAGCLPLRYGQSLDDSIPEVDLFIGPNQIDQIAELIESSEAKKKYSGVEKKRPLGGFAFGDEHKTAYEFKRALSTPGYAYLRISDGCNHGCKFCSIPLIRGKLKSETTEGVVREAKELADLGIREIILVAQDLTSYGRDLGLKNGLVELLQKLESISGVDWIRLMYLYPSGIKDGLIELIRGSRKILPYLDVPIQHISDNVLKSMGRTWRGAQIRELIDSMRSKIPNIAIRTTVMVGFPTETEPDFDELKSFITEVELDHVGVFTYFKEESTPAEKLGDPIPKKVKKTCGPALYDRFTPCSYRKKTKRESEKPKQPLSRGFQRKPSCCCKGGSG